jgi:hypothetical protein
MITFEEYRLYMIKEFRNAHIEYEQKSIENIITAINLRNIEQGKIHVI